MASATERDSDRGQNPSGDARDSLGALTLGGPRSADSPRAAALAATWPRYVYLGYATFSWPWFWWRLLAFAPFAVVVGAHAGFVHGVFVESSLEGFSVAWRGVIAVLLLVGFGPLLGTGARHLNVSQAARQTSIVLCIIVGFFVADLANRWADNYHSMLMQPYAQAMGGSSVGTQVGASMWETAKRAIWSLAIYFLFGGGVALASHFRGQHSREREQRRELEEIRRQKVRTDAQLSVLQAQVEPHFLFNTMASVRSLLRRDPARAEHTIDALVGYLRATLPKLRDEEGARSTLAAQIEICRSYLEVMRLRIGDRFTYTIDVPAEVAALPFPPLILISLVENAIKHGIERKRGACRIDIGARVLGTSGEERLEVAVADDGAGLREGTSQGLGLANVRAQLAARYGGRASLSLNARDGGGVVAALVIPLEATMS
jgi:hypothetical protein